MTDPVVLYLSRVEALTADDTRLTPLAAGILAAAELGIATDSVAFGKALGISHALVLREIETLEHDLGLVYVTSRNPRTQRTFYELSVPYHPAESAQK